MSNKKKFQEKANALFEKYPNENKVIITENGQCFFDEKAAQDYHTKKWFDKDPEIFFREGHEDEDDSDLQEALHNAQLVNSDLTAVIDEVASVADLDHEYEPANFDTNETVTAVIALREKYAAKDGQLIEANAELEKLSKVVEENTDLKAQLDAANKQIELLSKPTTNVKTK
jgi:hypothetical protein